MTAFPIDEGDCGTGTGSYEAGLVTLANGEAHGVEQIARLTQRSDVLRKLPAIPGFLGSLRSLLPAAGRLSMPARLAVSTVRAGLGVVEEGFAPDGAEPLPIAIAFADGRSVVARMPSDLIALIRRDREIALGALARQDRPGLSAPDEAATTEALTSIFRYEKRNGRLRRVSEPEPSAKD